MKMFFFSNFRIIQKKSETKFISFRYKFQIFKMIFEYSVWNFHLTVFVDARHICIFFPFQKCRFRFDVATRLVFQMKFHQRCSSFQNIFFFVFDAMSSNRFAALDLFLFFFRKILDVFRTGCHFCRKKIVRPNRDCESSNLFEQWDQVATKTDRARKKFMDTEIRTPTKILFHDTYLDSTHFYMKNL